MLSRRVGGPELKERERHCTSGSFDRSDLGVRVMWVEVLKMNVITLGFNWVVGIMERKEGWEMVVQLPLLSSNLTQGSWIRMISADFLERCSKVCMTLVDFAVLCCIKRMVWWVLC